MRTKMTKDEVLIDYRYLNMESEKFEINQEEMIKHLPDGSLMRAIPNYKNNQVLYAGGINHFEEVDAIQLCRKISGLDRFGNKKEDNKWQQ